MQQVCLTDATRLHHAPHDSAVEGADALLLLALLGSGPEGLRSLGSKDVLVFAGHVSVPRRHAAARDDDHPRRIDREGFPHPLEERNPIQELEAHLSGPWPNDDRQAAAGDARHALHHTLLGLGAPLIDAAAAQQPIEEPALPQAVLARPVQRAPAGGGVLPQRVGRLIDGVEPGSHRVGAPFVVDAQLPQVLQHGPDLLPLPIPARIDRRPQPFEGASQA